MNNVRLLVSTEQRYEIAPDGSYWSQGGLTYDFWRRYLDVFDEVHIFARAQNSIINISEMARADGPNVKFVPVPYFVGVGGFIHAMHGVFQSAQLALKPRMAIILRIPSLLATVLEREIQKRSLPYGVEVIGDADQVFAARNLRIPFRRIIRLWAKENQRRQCWNAAAASYVTDHVLQKLYPCKKAGIAVSDVGLSKIWTDDRITRQVPRYTRQEDYAKSGPDSLVGNLGPCRRVRLIFVGTLEQLYKGPDLAIAAVAELVRYNIDVELIVVGGGKFLSDLQKLATRLEIENRIIFKGSLSNPEHVRNELDQSDIFIMPSRTEGMPRAMIEAMARGLPCIGANVGGIPELLDRDSLIPKDDYISLAHKIRELVLDDAKYRVMSSRSLSRAADFTAERLYAKRSKFLLSLLNETQDWMSKH